MAYAYTLLG